MRARPLLATLLAAGALAPAAPARASFHLMKVVEVFPGTAADPQAQYVVLQMYAAGQNLVQNHSLTVYGADGDVIAMMTFPPTNPGVPNGADQAKILIGTADAETFFGVTPDLSVGSALLADGGKVCWDVVDCVAWGVYAPPASDPTVGTPFNSPGARVAGTPGPGLVLGRAMVRRLDLAGGASNLDAGDDTNDSAHDFKVDLPAPINNAGVHGTIPAANCGNGNMEGLEGCDDGNTTSGDGCSATCQEEFCGDGAVTGSEACDDGNATSGDGCDSNCKPTGCGNGVVTTGEACDDGNLVSGDGCDANCTVTACGNGIVTSGETCDDGNLTSGDGCDANCTPTGCGNGIVTPPEACDPPGGTCSAECQRICLSNTDCADTDPCTTAERCVNTACVVDPTPVDDGEPCTVDSCDALGVHHTALDDGNACVLAGQPGARALCLDAVCGVSRCGDGWVDAGAAVPEACDDGNAVNDDGCTNACTLPRCGDGIVQAGEACDGGSACTASCQKEAAMDSSGCGCGHSGGAPDLALAGLLLGALALRGRRRFLNPPA